MNQNRLLTIILAPVVSEKTTMISAYNQYAFKVIKNATKREIKSAVEMLFGVNVEKVTTMNVKGKQKNYGRRIGRRSGWKKALVKVAEGQMIDVSTS